ncbi:MAG: CDP-diacylglycerol--glycerol-3-phosphate 3-phosphatidyltransferase [Nitrospirae bacterium]|nr:MAG: CDP-diacylglycerol--glycerol-3-phosphate 3-phosphatidyltransferase [Nitrospirota bacterium]
MLSEQQAVLAQAHGQATSRRLAGLLRHVPNAITVSRILLIPVFVLVFLEPTPSRSLAAAAIFGVAALTDAVDGYIARRWGQITQLGKLLDPIADKLLVLTALFLLVDQDRVEAWIAIVLAGRELAVTGLRGVAAREGIVLAAEATGKLKMAAQVVAILLLILDEAGPTILNLHDWGTVVLLVSLVLSLVSAAQYIRQFVTSVRPRDRANSRSS